MPSRAVTADYLGTQGSPPPTSLRIAVNELADIDSLLTGCDDTA